MGRESCSRSWSQSTFPFASLKPRYKAKHTHSKPKQHNEHKPTFCRALLLGQYLFNFRNTKLAKRYSPYCTYEIYLYVASLCVRAALMHWFRSDLLLLIDTWKKIKQVTQVWLQCSLTVGYFFSLFPAHLPLVGVSHDNVSALLVVLSNAHLGHILRPFDPQSLINLILLQKHTQHETN